MHWLIAPLLLALAAAVCAGDDAPDGGPRIAQQAVGGMDDSVRTTDAMPGNQPTHTRQEVASIINIYRKEHPEKNLLVCTQDRAEYHGSNWWHCSLTVFHEISRYITAVEMAWPSPSSRGWLNPFEECFTKANDPDSPIMAEQSGMIDLYLEHSMDSPLFHWWRCGSGIVYACEHGANPRHCNPPETATVPHPGIIEFCEHERESDFLPGYLGISVWHWGCTDGAPIILGRLYEQSEIDQWGYVREYWEAISPESVYDWE